MTPRELCVCVCVCVCVTCNWSPLLSCDLDVQLEGTAAPEVTGLQALWWEKIAALRRRMNSTICTKHTTNEIRECNACKPLHALLITGSSHHLFHAILSISQYPHYGQAQVHQQQQFKQIIISSVV
jgi:hypothetical protein